MRYEIRNAVVRYAADTILENATIEINDGDKIAIVGRNGCGKTTLLKLISGEIKMDNLDSDEECGIIQAGNPCIGYLKQISFEDTQISVEDEILKVFEPVFACEGRMAEIAEEMKSQEDEKLLKEYARLQAKMEALNGYHYREEMETMFLNYGFALEDLKAPIGTLSGGQQTKVAFIKLLLSKPDILLLDEPTNHLDIQTIEWLEDYLKNYNKAVVIVSHDRVFLDKVVNITYEIEYHRMKRYVGNYTAFVEQKEQNAEKQLKDYEAQQKEIERLTAWIEKWKNTPTKVAATRSKRKVIEHMELIEKPRRFDTKEFHAQFQPLTTSFSDVIEAQKLCIGYDKPLCEVSFLLKKGERLAVMGANGIGKSTLLKTLIGKLPSLGGKFKFGNGVQWAYFDQQAALAASAKPEMTVLDSFWEEYPRLKEVEVRNALGSFLFTQDEVYKKLGQLSGGEKVRLALCKLFKKRPNLLILDEPTNHMDIVGIQALERMLKSYTGTVLFVSHDRYFVKEVATEVLHLEEETSTANQTTSKNPSTRSGDKKSKAAPTLDDVFDKKTYYNPGKIRSRLQQQLKKYERMLAESEERMAELQMQQMNPELATNYEELAKITDAITAEEGQQESLLERMMETESELFEMTE